MPAHVIDKAIDKGKGHRQETFTEGRYEFGSNDSMLIVDLDIKCWHATANVGLPSVLVKHW